MIYFCITKLIQLRIIGGKYKGRVISNPKGFNSRITTDRAKESLFNILNNDFYFEDISVLDMFAGSGNITYEFASRGSDVIAIEKNYKNYTFISSNIKKLGLTNVKLLKGDCFNKTTTLLQKFDIIFADPPFSADFISQIPDFVFNNQLLKKYGILIVEHDKRNSFSSDIKLYDVREYGGVKFSFFRNSK